MIASIETGMLPSPPAALLDGASLFVDFDGTLVEIVDRPDAVFVDEPLRDLLAGLSAALGGRVAIVSGRSLNQIDELLGPIAKTLALSGSHGIEQRCHGVTTRPVRPATLDQAVDAFCAFIASHPGTIVETKSYSVALHYRQAPALERPARELAARLADELDLKLELGKMVVELRVGVDDKGIAVRRLMACPPMAGSRPLFIGDDLTDEAGFDAVRAMGGAGILVGEPRATAAEFALPDVAAVRNWLARATR